MEERIARKKGEPRLLLSLLCVPRTAASGIARWLLRVGSGQLLLTAAGHESSFSSTVTWRVDVRSALANGHLEATRSSQLPGVLR